MKKCLNAASPLSLSIPEDVILASAASSSLSAPASPSAVEAAGGTPHSTPSGGSRLPHQQQLPPTTSSAAGGSSSVAHVTPSSSCQHQYPQHHQPVQQQRRLSTEEPHHSSTAASVYATTGSNRYSETPLLTPPQPAAVPRDSRLPQLLPAPSSPTLSRALQGKRKQSLEGGEVRHEPSTTYSLQSPSQQPISTNHPSSIAWSSSDSESIPSRQQLALAPSIQQADHPPSSLHVNVPEASGAVDDQSRGRNVDVSSGGQDQTWRNHAQQSSPAAVQPQTSLSLSQHNTAAGAAASKKTEPTSSYDSVPLYHEIRELRKAKSIVEKGSATLILSKEGKGSSSAPSPGKSPSRGENSSTRTGTPSQTIPRQRSLDLEPSTAQVPRLNRAATSIEDDYSSTVMTCTKNVPSEGTFDQQQLGTEGDSSAVSSATSRLSPRSDSRRDLPPTSDSSRTSASKCPRSPVTKHNYLRRQKEERDSAAASGKHLDYKAISPKGSPLPTRGKPPLPRQNTPVRQTPHPSPATPEKGPRSKSVGEMSQSSSGTAASNVDSNCPKPLQDAINKFEKRQTMCETDDRPIELRKTPSPTLHLPRVGLVSRVRRLKPAAELLEESQRFRSGHSIYATRIMQRYLPKDESKPVLSESSSHSTIAASSGPGQNNKENNFVHTMVRRLSRETSPIKSTGSSRTNSELSLKRTDSPRSNSEFVSHIVRKLSSGSGSGSPRYKINPFKDRTNDGQVKKMAQSFDEQSPERTLSDSELGRGNQQQSPPTGRRFHQKEQSAIKAQHRKSCEVAMVLSSSSAATTEPSLVPSTTDQAQRQQHAGSSSPTTPPNHQSLPALALSSEGAPSRHRAATYCHSEPERRQKDRDPPPARPASASSAYDPHGHQLAEEVSEGAKSKGTRTGRSAASSLSPVRRGTGRGKMGTVRVLCKQSISFDLGVSLYTQKAEAAGGGSPKSTRQVRSWDPSESARAEAAASSVADSDIEPISHSSPGPTRSTTSAEGRPVSSGSEGEAAHSSTHSEEKTKFRRFLDSSKKFFKVSK